MKRRLTSPRKENTSKWKLLKRKILEDSKQARSGRDGSLRLRHLWRECEIQARWRRDTEGNMRFRAEGCDPSLVSSYLCPGVGIRLYRQRGSRGDDFLIDSGNRLEGIDWSHTGIFEVSISHECDVRTGTQVRSCDKCPPRRKGHIVRNV